MTITNIIFIFRHIEWGGEIIICAAFFSKFCQISTLSLHLVNSSHFPVTSADALHFYRKIFRCLAGVLSNTTRRPKAQLVESKDLFVSSIECVILSFDEIKRLFLNTKKNHTQSYPFTEDRKLFFWKNSRRLAKNVICTTWGLWATKQRL